jgi:hypothetical protein
MNHWTNHGPGPNGPRVAYCTCGWTQPAPNPQAAHSAAIEHRDSVDGNPQH